VGVILKREPLEKIIYKITMEEKGSNMLQEKFTSFKLIAVVGVTVDGSA
jgi:energy-converting hydrogenase Eha subunit C